MSIRIRLILILVLLAVAPSLIALWGVTTQMQDLVVQSGEATMEEIARTSIREKARSTALLIAGHLAYHPEIDLGDLTALEADRELTLLSVQPVGQTGYTAVFDANAITHFHANPGMVGMDMSTLADSLPEFWAIFEASLDGSPAEGYYNWEDADGTIRRKFMAVLPVEGTPLRVAATTYVDEFTQPAQGMMDEFGQIFGRVRRNFLFVSAIMAVVALGVVFLVAMWFTAPIQRMALSATRVMEGDWEAIQPSNRQDELGVLDRALYGMTHRARELVAGLEEQVAERTAHLTRQIRYQEAMAVVARSAASVLDIEDLLSSVVDLVSKQFDVYHTGLFTIDASGQWAELQAASSEGGRRMLARNHRLRVGTGGEGQGIVGIVAASGEHRLALDVGVDAAHFDNPDLSETRSELALPLRARGEMIGVLDVQSKQAEAFTESDVRVLQALSDQVALAISNARLFRQAGEGLSAAQRAYGQLGRDAWRRLIDVESGLGFISDEQGTSPAGDLWEPQMQVAVQTAQAARTQDGAVTVPIQLHGQVIGLIDVRPRGEQGAWTPEQVDLIETLTEQLGVALESARLYQDTRQRAAREQLIGQVTARVRESLDMNAILQTAAREMGLALDADVVEVRLGMGESNQRAGGVRPEEVRP
ncbi:MAG: GAF domain-containing protein [Anaerolineae bacterium]|nr:GAF domain-containing protein [Anaerolineae bacterium]